MLRRAFLALPLALAALPARAAGKPFETAAFQAAQKAGKPIVVVVYAEWCPTCRKQEPAVKALLETPEFAKFDAFQVDFDMQDEVLRAFRVTKQSTLLVFKGEREVTRATGLTRPEAIAELLRKAL